MQTFAAIMTMLTMLPFAAAAAEPCTRVQTGVLCTSDGFDKLIGKYRDRDAAAKTCEVKLEAAAADAEATHTALVACHAVIPEVKPAPKRDAAVIGMGLGFLGGALIASGFFVDHGQAYLALGGAASAMAGLVAALWE